MFPFIKYTVYSRSQSQMNPSEKLKNSYLTTYVTSTLRLDFNNSCSKNHTWIVASSSFIKIQIFRGMQNIEI